MSFQQALSGLNAATRSLDVIGHNIANAGTVGMKSSRAEFAEIYASSAGSIGGTNTGLGVDVAAVSQQFSQGTLAVTGNDLDVAINGGGFFQVQNTDGSTAYTRAGNFKLDKSGAIITNTGAQVMGYPTDIAGVRQSADAVPLTLPTGAPIAAKQT
ncbi:MAG: flagellar hook-basal body complex protein, partial [Comamonadaceae bacterium]